jgi:transcriptional regulator with XRE-family HTH domain
MTLSDRLRRLLEARSMSISEVSRLAGLSRQQVHRIVSGSNPNPGILLVERIAGAMGLSLGELFADD